MPDLDYISKAKLLFIVKTEAKKERHRSRIEKPYSRTTAHNRSQGWGKRVQRHYLNTRRLSEYQKALSWYVARQPIT